MKLDDLIKHYEILDLNNGDVNIGYVINNLKEFRILNKPHVDQFIADWYETYKDNLEYSLWEWMRHEPNREKNKEFYLWLNNASNNPVETLVKMKLFGYKVKKVKRYLVKIKGVNKGFTFLKFDKTMDSWYFGNDTEYRYKKNAHTRKELEEAGFEWVFNCPGIEIEEVEE
jgi:hypothetical protein